MVLLKNNFFKRIIVSLSIMILLVFFCMSPISNASKLKLEDGEFYYAGTTKGQYVVTEGVFAWLLSKIGEIADFLLGIMTMGGRMVFVGWTALFEKVLTWALEATTGVPMDVNKLNATSVEQNTNSSDNVTVEAIVYNQVPIFNINFFSEEEVRRCVSGTGRFVIECDACAEEWDKDGLCRMRECNCELCKGVLEEEFSNNIITVVRKNVSSWYTVIRYIAIAAMLCLLIGIGIKMAITSVAQDKAMYKRMLVDWLVGMVLLFSIHFIMVFCVNINESIVDIIKGVETNVSEITKKELKYETKTDDELEISIYEAVRTRAYDAKLINGTTGMILYITLVFYAFRFCFVYFKRYLTMIALTLMAPGVALAYAFQKAMTGKSKSFSKWLQEYFVNAFIQSIHAMIYTAFVSTALIVSLNSVSGMIFALVIMNFMLKAEKIFRKVFKLTEGGSLAENTLDKSDPKQLMQSAQTAASFMTGVGLMKKSPVTKAIKAPLRAVKTGVVRAAINVNEWNNTRTEDQIINKQINKNNDLKEIINGIKDARISLGGSAKKEFTDFMNTFNEQEDFISLDGEDAIEKELDALEQEAFVAMQSEDKDVAENAKNIYANVQYYKRSFDRQTNLTTGQVFKAHLDRILDRNNYYDYDATAEKGKKYTRGKMVYDPIKNKMVKKRMADLISEQFTIKNMLSMTEQDEKLFKETKDLAKGTLIGMGSMFIGLGTVVSDPLIGMGLLANGVASRHTFLDKIGALDTNKNVVRVVSDKNKRYSFNRFGKGAKQTITRVIEAQAEGEKDRAVVENVKENHQKFYKRLKLGGMGIEVAGAVGIATIVGGVPLGVTPVMIAATTAYTLDKVTTKKYGGHSPNSLIGRIEKNHFKQYKDLRKKLVQDEIDMLSRDEKREYKENYAELIALMTASSEQQKNAPQITQQEQKDALEAGTAVKTKDGQVVSLSRHVVKDEMKLIEQATAEILVSKATSAIINDDTINSVKTMDEVKKALQLKLKAQGKMEDGTELKIENIEELDKKIKESAYKIVRELDGEEQVDEAGNPEVGIIDTFLMQEAIKEQISNTNLKDIASLDKEAIFELMTKKKQEIYSIYSSDQVTERLQELKGAIQNRETILPGMDIERQFKMEEGLKKWKEEQKLLDQRRGIFEKGDRSFKDKTAISKEANEAIQSTLMQIKQPAAVVSDPDRNKKQAKQEADTLKALLEGVALDTKDTKEVSINNEVRSVDDVVKELFANTGQQEKAYELISNVKSMRRLNKRGDNVKVKSKDREYSTQKYLKNNKEDTAIPEVYGPVTNIIDLIRDTDKNIGKK